MKDPRIVALIELQSVINEKNELYRTHEAVPDRLEELRSKIEEAEAKLAAAEKEVTDLGTADTKATREKSQASEKLTELQTKLNLVKTTREYENRQKEIKAQKDRLVEIEKTTEEAKTRKPELEVNVESFRKETEEVKEHLSAEIDELEKQKKAFDKQLEEIETREQERRVDVPTAILERVDKLVLLRQGVAVVPINDGSCGGCGIHVSPQTIQVAKRGLDLIQCDRCSSYLYWDDDHED